MSATSILPLRVANLGYAVRRQDLIRDVTFDLPAGGVTMLLGANGAGKSLLLRLCHGLIAPTHGAVRWASAPRPGAHAMVFQKPVMLRRSARANITHALSATGAPRSQIIGRTYEALRRFDIAHLADQPARVLSGGEQQRLAIARAWALRPELLFLDEPTSHLDPAATNAIEQMLKTLAAEGMTLLMATHDLPLARRLGDRIVFLDRGALIEDSAADEFFAAPKTPQARAFLEGRMR